MVGSVTPSASAAIGALKRTCLIAVLVETERRRSGTAERVKFGSIPLDHPHDSAGCFRGPLRDLDDSFEEEPKPILPPAVEPDGLEMVVVLGAIPLQIQAQIEKRLRQHVLRAQEQGDQKASDTSVSVEEWMDCLELGVCQCGLYEDRSGDRVVVEEPLQPADAQQSLVCRRGDEGCVAGARSADPVLCAPELARIAFLTPPTTGR